MSPREERAHSNNECQRSRCCTVSRQQQRLIDLAVAVAAVHGIRLVCMKDACKRVRQVQVLDLT